MDAEIRSDAWEVPIIFRWLQQTGDVETSEMRRVFNMGIGMAAVVSDFYAPSIASKINDLGVSCRPIGRIVKGSGVVRYTS